MPLPPEVWVAMLLTAAVFWGVSGWALVRTLRQEERKTEILERQRVMDTYSPRALAELREWIRENPDDPYRADAVEKYNECVRALQSTDRHFYDWDDEEIRSLNTI